MSKSALHYSVRPDPLLLFHEWISFMNQTDDWEAYLTRSRHLNITMVARATGLSRSDFYKNMALHRLLILQEHELRERWLCGYRPKKPFPRNKPDTGPLPALPPDIRALDAWI